MTHVKDIADAGFSPDRHTASDQHRHVAIERRHKDTEFACMLSGRGRPTPTAENLINVKEATGAGHTATLPD